MPIKADMIFRHDRQGLGWLESWYFDISDLPSALDKIEAIGIARLGLLPSNASLEFVRATTNVPAVTGGGPRRRRESVLRSVGRQGSAAGPLKDGDTAWAALKLRYNSTTAGVFRCQQLRAMSDVLFDIGGINAIANAIRTPFFNFVTALKTQDARIRHRTGNPTTLVYSAILNCQLLGITHRDTGRPFYLPRGRR